MSEPSEKEPVQITMGHEEFHVVLERVHKFLLSRAEAAKAVKDASGSELDAHDHVEAAKDVFVVIHMMELIKHFSIEVNQLRELIAAMAGNVQAESDLSSVFAPKRTNFLN